MDKIKKLIAPTQENLNILSRLTPVPISLCDNVSPSFLLDLVSLDTKRLKSFLGSHEPKAVIQFFSTNFGPINPLHLALLNPNIEVFKSCYAFLKSQNVDVNAIFVKKNSFDESLPVGLELYPELIAKGSTLFNVALQLANCDKIEFLKLANLTSFICPTLCSDISFDGDTRPATVYKRYYESNLLDYALHLSHFEVPHYLSNIKLHDFESNKDKTNFYLDFALSFNSFEEHFKLLPLSAKNYQANCDLIEAKFFMPHVTHNECVKIYSNIFFKEELWDNQYFVQNFVPVYFKCLFRPSDQSQDICTKISSYYDELENSFLDKIVYKMHTSKYFDEATQNNFHEAMSSIKNSRCAFYLKYKGKPTNDRSSRYEGIASLLSLDTLTSDYEKYMLEKKLLKNQPGKTIKL